MRENFSAYEKVLLTTTRERYRVTAAKDFTITLKGEDGTFEVIDAVSQVGANPLGHRYEPLLREIRKLYEADSEYPLMVAGNDYYHEHQKALAEKFTSIFPGDLAKGDLKTFFCNSGSEAVERGCLKAAQLHKGGNSWISFLGAFHGRTALALSMNFSKAAHKEGYHFLQRTLPTPFPMKHPGRFDRPADYADECFAYLKELVLREGPKNISGLIMEPVQGEGGYIVPPERFLQQVRELCSDHNIPLIADEVQSALRTGHWFASEGFGVEPDMIALAKSFSGGITPFGASLIKTEFANTVEGKQSNTFGGNPKDCFVALKTIELIEENNFLENAKKQGKRLAKHLEDVFEDNAAVKDHRGKGLMRAIELQDTETRDRIYHTMIEEHGVLAHPCGNDKINPSIRFLPSVNIDAETIDVIGTAVSESVATHT